MEETELFFNLVFVFFCMCVVYPPEVFLRLGLTVEQLFAPLLGNEAINFIRYHQRRTSLNLVVHSCLPLLYFLIHHLKFSAGPQDKNNKAGIHQDGSVVFRFLFDWQTAQNLGLMALLAVPIKIFLCQQKNWQSHPISKTLSKYSNDGDNYEPVAIDITNEIRRPLIYRHKLNSISSVIATENWIIKTSIYDVNFAHQSNASIIVAKTETYNIAMDTNDELQMLNITVNPNRAGVRDFEIRINALEFRNLENCIRRPITIPQNIVFHRTIVDRFIDVFKQQVALNPTVTVESTEDKCNVCLISEPNVKIKKQCADIDNQGRPLAIDQCCTNCYCRPRCCVECLARWFLPRQGEIEPEIWLQQRSTCPVCRARFCILDVSYVQIE